MYYSLALKSTGAAWGWGSNTSGQIGNSSVTSYSSPVAVVGSHAFTYITTYNYTNTATGSTIGLKSDGSLWAWGYNIYGQLGTGNTTSYSSPVLVVGSHSFISVYCAGNHTVALKANGEVWCWGANESGQLGQQNITSYSSPVLVVGSHSFTQIAAGMGGRHTLALKSDGSVWAWGANASGQIGNSSTNNASSPVVVVGSHSFSKITAGFDFTVALKANGTAWCWGSSDYGQIGDNLRTNVSSPVAVVGSHSFTDINAAYKWTLALKSTGAIWAWGNNTCGNLGTGNVTSYSSPVLVVGSHAFTQMATGRFHSIGLKSDGSIWSWGYNTYGALGDNSRTSFSSPVLVVGSHVFSSLMNNVAAAPTTPSISSVGDSKFFTTDVGIVIAGANFKATQSTGKVELGNNATYASASKQSLTVTAWADTSITVNMSIGALTQGYLWVFVTNSDGNTSTGFYVYVSDTMKWGIATDQSLDAALAATRAMGGTSPNTDNMRLVGAEILCGSVHTNQLRLAVYTGGSLSDPSGATLLKDFGETTGTATATWLTLTTTDVITLPKNAVTWVVAKSTSGPNFKYGSSNPTNSDFQSDNGRWDSVAISTDSTVEYPATWPSDGGSFGTYWYCMNVLYTVQAATASPYTFGMKFLTDSSQSLATVSNFTPPDRTNGGTVCFWMSSTHLTGAHSLMGSSGTYEIRTDGTILYNDLNWGTSLGSNIAVNTRYHVAMAYGGTLGLNGVANYLNGVKDTSSGNATGNPSPAVFTIGQSQGTYFTGYLEDIRIYNRNLSEAEILTIYSDKGGDGIVYGLIHRWPLCCGPEGVAASGASSIKDLGITGLNMTPTNSPVFSGTDLKQRRRLY